MADIPLYPDAKNVDTFRDFVNIQKEIFDLLMAQKKEYEQIGRINLDIEKRVVARRVEEKKWMDLISTKIIERGELMEKSIKATSDKDLDLSKALLKDNERIIDTARERLNLSMASSNIEIDMAKRKYEDENKYFTFASSSVKKLFGIEAKVFDVTKGWGEEFIKLGVRGELIVNTLGAVLMMLAGAFTLFTKFDTAAWGFRKAMGATRPDVADIRKQAQGMAIEFMGIGVTIDGAYKSFQALGMSVGGIHNVTKSMAEDVAIMSAQLGISEETSAGFLRNMAAISKHTMESQVNSMYIAQNMSAAAGVQLDQVMGDISKRSEKTLLMMSRMPNVALRTAIELRRMGTDLNAAANSSRHILDFDESIREEMEASVLLGRSINLQRARELSYRRDLEGSTKEILRITKSINFENLDVFQQEAFSRATGKSVDELLRMLQASRQLEHVQRSGTPQQKEQLALYEKMRKSNEAAVKARAKDFEATYRVMANQERITAITAKWNALLAKAQEWLLPIIDKMLELALPAMDVAVAIMKWSFVLGAPLAMLFRIGKTIEVVGLGLAIWFEKSSKISNIFFKIAGFGNKLMGPWMRISALFGGVLAKLGFFGKFLGFFGKLLGPIGWVITAFQAIGGFIKGFNSTTGGWISKLGGGLMGALRNIIPGFDYIVRAVKWVWGWLVKIVEFSFKWFSPISWIINGFKLLKSLFPETFAALGGLFGKVWEYMKQAFSMAWDIVKVLFKWTNPIWLVIQGINMIGPSIANTFGGAWSALKDFFGSMFAGIGGIKDRFVGAIKAWAGAVDSFGAYIVKRITLAFQRAFTWVADKFASVINFFSKILGGGGVEKKAAAAYIPAATITPTGTTVNPLKKEGALPAKGGGSETEHMSEETGQKMVALLEKILKKDSNVHMDGQLLSTHLARQTEFRGGYGVNKVA